MPKRPGDAVMAGAERDFARVVADLNAAGDECARALRVACADAPQERSWWDEAGAFVQGALEAGVDYAKLLFFPVSSSVAFAEQVGRWWDGRLNASEVVALQLRPIEMMGDLAQAGWNDPRGTGLAALAGAFDVQTWLDDPARAAGRLAPDAVIGAATGGVGAAANKMGKFGLKADQIHAGAKALNRVHHFPFNRRTTSFPEFRAPRPSAAYTENVTASGLGVKHALPQASHHPSPRLHAEDAGLPRGRHPHPDPAFNQEHENPHAQRKALFPTLEERLNPTPDHTPEPVKTDDIRTNSVTSEGLKDDVNLPAQHEEPTKTNDDTPVEPRPNTDTSSSSAVTPDETRDTDTDSPETETAPEAPASTGQPNADTPHTKETPDSTTPNNTDNAEHAKPEPKPDSDSPAADEASEAAKTDNIATDNVSPEGNKEAGSPVRADKSTDADPSVDADSAATQSNTSHTDSASPEGKNDPANNTIHDGHVRNPDPDNSVEPGKRGEFDADNSATANNKVSQEEADEASTNGSDEKKKDWQLTPEVEARRAQPATTVDDVCACVTRWDGKNVLAPPNDASEMNTMTRSLIKDIDEIFGRNEDGSLRSYNEWHAKYSKWIEDSPEIYHGAYRSESHLFGEAVPEEAETAGIEGMVHNGMTHHETTGIQETLRRLYDLPEDGVIRFDRIGEPSGQYLGLIGKDGPASFGERSLAPTSVHGEYYVYELNVDDLPEGWSMTVGKVAPWHGGKGGAIQIQFFGPKGTTDLIEEKSIAELMRVGIVRDVTPR